MKKLDRLSATIWDMKYRLKTDRGDAVDKNIEDSWRRIAATLAAAEPAGAPGGGPDRWQARFFEALQDFAFLPAGRIQAGAGSGRKVTLFNCFVMG
ncbi:MAG TPA: ribonucleotide reductase N-terminal alpha domain-containing protein, partial [Kiloniellaceae bacterium]|nr:ribonucleotide reductase N-terminal alpha domain-containing protein [Kiloniellaceae bacterium]